MLKHPRIHKRRQLPHAQYPGTARIEAFSDGVIAIIITIMVLELRVPRFGESFTRDDFWWEMAPFWPKLLTYAMSFMIVGIFWVNHHGFFHMLKKSDGKLVWFNNFMLFWMSLIPFGTAFLGEHPTSPEAIMVFASILAITAMSFPLMGYYAMFLSDLMHESISTEARNAHLRRSWPGSALYLTALLIAPYSIWVSWGIFFIVPVYYFLPRRMGEGV